MSQIFSVVLFVGFHTWLIFTCQLLHDCLLHMCTIHVKRAIFLRFHLMILDLQDALGMAWQFISQRISTSLRSYRLMLWIAAR